MKTFVFIGTFDFPSRYAHAIHALEMARAFSRALGDRFLFVCNTAVDPAIVSGIRYRQLFGRYGRRIKKLRLRRLLFIPAILLVLARERPEVIYTTEPGLYRAGLLLSRLFHARFVAECHGNLLPRQAHAFSRADVRIFVTEGLRERFVRAMPAMGPSIVLPNAVDAARFDAVSESGDQLRDSLALPRGRFLIGYVGRFEPLGLDKGLKLMIDALPMLSLDTDIVLVGGTKTEVAEYRRYAEERGYGGRVHIVPHVDSRDVPRYAKACDCLAYVPPSNEFTEVETSPMKLYEYMAAGRPIIASDTAAIRHVVRSEATLVTPGSREAFIAGITALRQNLPEMQNHARRALARVALNTWDTRVAQIVQAARAVV